MLVFPDIALRLDVLIGMNALQYAIIDFNNELVTFTSVQEIKNQVPQLEVLVDTNKKVSPILN